MAVPAELPGFASVPVMFVPLPPDPPVIPPVITGAPQLYVILAGTMPFVPFKGVEVNVSPEHIVAVMLEIAGIGLTVTVTVNVAPVQLPDSGVTVYVAV